MAGIAGILNRNGEPVDGRVLERMAKVVPHRGPDGVFVWKHESIGLVQLLMATTPEDLVQSNPFDQQPPGFRLVFDGRIDNRKHLLHLLNLKGETWRAASDSAITMQAYLKWGIDFLLHMRGDFALALWDESLRRLVLCRDISGIRPLYYSKISSGLLFGSEISQVLQHPLVSPNLNLGRVAEVLATAPLSAEETLYSEIRVLPARKMLLADDHETLIRSYWAIDWSRRIRYEDERQYVEHFCNLLTSAIDARVRSRGPVGVTLSGGIDSSLVAAIASSLIAQGEGKGTQLEAFSVVFPGRECDEQSVIEETVKHCSLRSTLVPFTSFEDAFNWQQDARETRVLPESPVSVVMHAQVHQMRAINGRVMLSGVGAGMWFGGVDYPWYGILKESGLAKVYQHAWLLKDSFGMMPVLRSLNRSLIWPVLPQRAKHSIERSRLRYARTELLDERFLVETGLLSRMHQYDCASQFADLGRWETEHSLQIGLRDSFMTSESLVSARFGLEDRHPFLDQELIEFSTAIPEFQKSRAGRTKSLLRDLGDQLLPDKTMNNKVFSEFGCVYLSALAREESLAVLGDLEISRLGWVSQSKVDAVCEQLLQRFRATPMAPYHAYDIRYLRLLSALWAVFAVEQWIRAID